MGLCKTGNSSLCLSWEGRYSACPSLAQIVGAPSSPGEERKRGESDWLQLTPGGTIHLSLQHLLPAATQVVGLCFIPGCKGLK